MDYEEIKTYDQWHEMLLGFKNECGADAALILPSYGCTNNNTLAAGYGTAINVLGTMDTPFLNVDGTIEFGPFRKEAFLGYLEMMQQWYAEGLIHQDYMTSGMGTTNELVSQSRGGVWCDYVYNMHAYDSGVDDSAFYTVPLSSPILDGGKIYLSPPTELNVGEGISLTTACEDVETICRWMDYFYSEEGHIIANYGFEGISYTIENGEIVMTDIVVNDPNGIGWYRYTMPSKYTFVEEYTRRFSAYDEYQRQTAEIWGGDVGSWNIPGIAMMTSEESNTFATAWGDIGTYVTEFVNRFITGEIDASAYDEFIETIQGMDIETCIAVKQASLDRCLAKK